MRAADGKIATFEAPGASPATLGTGGLQYGQFTINTAGSIAGYYADSKYVFHGFLRSDAGTTTTFEAPGSGTVDGEGTYGLAINTAGDVVGTYVAANNVGTYVDASFVDHGFVRATDGTITTFEAPGAGSKSGQGTGGVSINADGDVAGFYRDATDVAHGFVSKP